MTVSGAYMRSTFFAFSDENHDGRRSVKIRDTKELKSASRLSELRQAKSLVIEDEAESMEKLPQSLASLDNITELVIKYCKTKALPPKLAALKQVTRLELNETQLKDIDVICRMTSLKELQLSHNCIKQLPADIGNLRLLEELNLNSNFLTVLPSQVGNLRNLLRLSVSANRLHHLPHSIDKLANLRSLDASRNVLEALPDELGKLTALSELDVGHNKLDFFPESLRNLRKLKFLYAPSNHLTEITDACTDLVALTNLHLQKNKIASINGCPPNVAVLMMSHNVVSDVSLLWRAPRYVRTLDLAFNRVTELPPTTPSHAQCLRMLNLSGNPLESLPIALSDCINLSQLNLSNTPVAHVPHEILHLPKLTSLNVHPSKLDTVLQSASMQGISKLRQAYQSFVPNRRPDMNAVQPRPKSEDATTSRDDTGEKTEAPVREDDDIQPNANDQNSTGNTNDKTEFVPMTSQNNNGGVRKADNTERNETAVKVDEDISNTPQMTSPKESPRTPEVTRVEEGEANNNNISGEKRVSGVSVKDMKSVFQANKPSVPSAKPKPATTAPKPNIKEKPVISSKPQFNGSQKNSAVFSRPSPPK